MTSAAESGGPSRRARLSAAIAHSVPYLLVAAVATMAASSFGVLVNLHYLVISLFLAGAVVSLVHRRSGELCIRCMTDVPADAPIRAERQKWVLRFAHFTGTLPAIIVLLALTFAPILLTRLVRTVVWQENLLFTPQTLWTFLVFYAEWVHHRLRPWCPYCRDWGDGGDPEPSPDPTTVGIKTAR